MLSRLEATDGEAPRDAIDVPIMLERLHRDALASADRPRQVILELQSEARLLFGSAHELESAFTNVLVNGAMKYTPAEGTAVQMRWWADDEGAYFSVIDSVASAFPRNTSRA